MDATANNCLIAAIDRLKKLDSRRDTVLVYGDYMVDEYYYCSLGGVSQEAPVMIYRTHGRPTRYPGGAGNLAQALSRFGVGVDLIGAGRDYVEFFFPQDDGMPNGVSPLEICTNCTLEKVSRKTRAFIGDIMVARLDSDIIHSPCFEEVENSIEWIIENGKRDIAAIAISDYGKGMVTPEIMDYFCDSAERLGIPLLLDPKEDAEIIIPDRGINLKCNAEEAWLLAGEPDSARENLCQVMRTQFGLDNCVVTCGQHGMYSASDDGVEHHEVENKFKNVVGTVGAGDVVMAMLTLCLVRGIDLNTACKLSNLAASISLNHLECYVPTLNQLETILMQRENQE